VLGDTAAFDSNEGLKRPIVSFAVEGLRIALPKIPQGSTATLYIPSVRAYGSVGSGSIPPNSILQFDIELFEVYAYNSIGLYCYDDPLLLPEVQLEKDIEEITQYLSQQSITAQVDPSGLRYTIETLGTGEVPKDDQCVRIKYAGRLLGSSSNFDENTAGSKFPMSRLIEGLRTGLKLIPKGSKATFYIPSVQAYGATGSGARIPPNANVVFDVELVDVVGYNATAGTCN
jgi:FKBP-type peptidyl-prolyl cis-trans isomerase